MAKHKGSAMTVQIWDAAANAGAGDWKHICGLDAREFAITTETTDTTIGDCDDPANVPLNKQTMAVMNEYAVSGDAIFANVENFNIMHNAMIGMTTLKLKMTLPEVGSYECPDGWTLTELKLSGGIKEALVYSVGFEPTGKVEFTAI